MREIKYTNRFKRDHTLDNNALAAAIKNGTIMEIGYHG
jgi:hypothetical protein